MDSSLHHQAVYYLLPMQSDPTTPLLISLTKTTYYVTVPNYMIRGGQTGQFPPHLQTGANGIKCPPPISQT